MHVSPEAVRLFVRLPLGILSEKNLKKGLTS